MVLSKSEQTIGLVGGNTEIVTVTPVLSTGGTAYASGDQVGTVFKIPGALRQIRADNKGNTAVLQSVTVIDRDDDGGALNLVLFASQPAITSIDNAALAMADDEAMKSLGWVAIAAADYIDIGNNKVACVKNIGLPVKADGNDLYGVLVTTGTPNYALPNDLVLKLGFLQD